jgi:hypothetical protein
MAPDEVSTMYRKVLAEIETYLNEMEVPPWSFQVMKSIPSSEVRWLSQTEIDAMAHVPSIDKWLSAGCRKGDFNCQGEKLRKARRALVWKMSPHDPKMFERLWKRERKREPESDVEIERPLYPFEKGPPPRLKVVK